MIPQQSFTQWQQNPAQGAVPSSSPLTPADEAFLAESLVECRARLQMALETAKGYSRLPDLGIGIGDALQGIEEALAVLADPTTYLDAYDVALSELPPTKGEIHPPELAF
jgi:hypothetical protein